MTQKKLFIVLLISFLNLNLTNQLQAITLNPTTVNWVDAGDIAGPIPFQNLKRCTFRLRADLSSVPTQMFYYPTQIQNHTANPAEQHFYFPIASPYAAIIEVQDPNFFLLHNQLILNPQVKVLDFLITASTNAGGLLTTHYVSNGVSQTLSSALTPGQTFLQKRCQ